MGRTEPRPRYDRRNDRWYVVIGGKRRILGREIDEAQAYERWVERFGGPRRAAGGAISPPEKVTLVVDAVSAWFRLFGRGRAWQRWCLGCWTEYVGNKTLASLSPDHLVEYANHLREHGSGRDQSAITGRGRRSARGGNSPKTIRHKVRAACTVLQWCHQRGTITTRHEMPALEVAEQSPRDIPIDELAKVFAAITGRSRAILTFILETGCRPAEACNLRWAEVDLAAGVCRPTHYKTKGRTALARVIYLTQPAKEIIGAIDRSGEFVFKSRLGRQYKPSSLRSILYKRGVTGGVYALRHTFAQAALATARMEVVSRLLGHADLRMVNVYAQVRDRQALEAVATLPSPLSYASDGDQPS